MKDTQQEIISEAYALFLQKGYKAVTMQEILEATGISKGAIYHYFNSKEEIFEAAVRRFYLGGLNREFDTTSCPSLKAFIEAEVEYMGKRRESLIAYSHDRNRPLSSNYFSVIFEAAQLLPGFRAELKAYRDKEYKLWEQRVQSALDAGEIQTGMKAGQVARLFLCVNKGLGMQLILDNKIASLQAELRLMWMAIYEGIKRKNV